MIYSEAWERRDLARIDKLNNLTNKATFWDDVRCLCNKTMSDHALHCWQRLAELRYNELERVK